VTFEQALSIGYAYLSRRERTEHELREHLLKRHAEPETTEAVLQELAEQGYVNDSRFARLFIQDKRHLSQWGSARIRRGLIERGIPREVGDRALGEEIDDPEDELHRALGLLAGRLGQAPETTRERERALGLLLRRGYEYELATEAISKYRSSR
jgi:regulatory protein